MNTSNNSIKAIIFTIILFLFIIFISLFKGIYLYNIKFKNVYIKEIFIKINHKIVLKINNITIKNTKNYTKQAVNLNKTILLVTKILNAFEEIEVNNLKYDSLIIKNLTFKNHLLLINSNYASSKAILNPNLKNTYINFMVINIPKYDITLKNFLFNIYFNKHNIKIAGNGEYNKQKIYYNLTLLQNNNLKFFIKTPYITYQQNKLKKLNIKGIVNLDYLIYNVNVKSNFADILYDKKQIISKNINIKLNNKDIKLTSKYLKASNLPKINNIKFQNLKVSYNISNKFLVANVKQINTTFKKYNIQSLDNNLIFQNIKNLTFTSKKLSVDNNMTLTLNNILLTIFNKYKSLTINNSKFINKEINLSSTKIISNFENIITKTIQGSVYNYDTKITDIKANIKNKSLNIKNITFHNINLHNISFKDNNLTLYSNTLLNQNLKDVLFKFLHIDIPIIQLKGENNITTKIQFPKIDTFTHIITTNSLFKIKDLNLSIPYANLNITNNDLKFNTKNSKFYLSKTLPITYNGKGIMNFKNSYLFMNGKIDFNLSNLICLNNYDETIFIDFKNNYLKTTNSEILFDFTKNQLIISSLKNILKYTPFNKYFYDGILMLNIKDYINVITYLYLKYKILLQNNKPIDKIFLNINVLKDYVNINNNFANIKIKDNNISINIKNVDINLTSVQKMLDTNESKKESNKSSTNLNLLINTKNVNLIYNTHKILSQKATIEYKNKNLKFNSSYKQSSINGYTKHNYLLLEGKNFTNNELQALLPKFDFVKKINFDFIFVKSPDEFFTGKVYINNGTVTKLTLLNNIMAFLNTIPSILSLQTPGYSTKGFAIQKGFINYLLYKNILYIKQAKIDGKNLSFHAKGYIDFNKKYIFLKLTANMKMKIKDIPIVGKGLSYLLFGKDGSIDVKIVVKGDLENPKVEKDIGKDILLTPFNLFKRAVTLPFNLF